MAMRTAYIFNHWNQFDIFIIVLAAADITIDHFLDMQENYFNIQMIKIVKMFRLTRALRLLKVWFLWTVD